MDRTHAVWRGSPSWSRLADSASLYKTVLGFACADSIFTLILGAAKILSYDACHTLGPLDSLKNLFHRFALALDALTSSCERVVALFCRPFGKHKSPCDRQAYGGLQGHEKCTTNCTARTTP